MKFEALEWKQEKGTRVADVVIGINQGGLV